MVFGIEIGNKIEQKQKEDDIQYVVGLLKVEEDPTSKTQKGDRVVKMTTKAGQQFSCNIPAVPSQQRQPQGQEEKEQEVDIATVIKEHLGHGCLTRVDGYWTYEICPFISAKQFHRDPQTNAIGVSFSLGTYDITQDTKHTMEAAYTQRFTSGTDNRQLTLYFRCNHDKQEHIISSIEEPVPFRYTAELRTPLACKTSKKNSSNIMDLLEPLSRTCIYLNTGWWLYKFCYLKGIQQLHRENRPIKLSTENGMQGSTAGSADSSVSGNNMGNAGSGTNNNAQTELVTVAEFDLGHLPKDSTQAQLEMMLKIVKGESVQETYVSQMYEDGTQCDLGNRENRKTEVRYYCDPNEPHAIESISETSTCSYVLKVKTRLLCSHPLFAADKPTVLQISCHPSSSPLAQIF